MSSTPLRALIALACGLAHAGCAGHAAGAGQHAPLTEGAYPGELIDSTKLPPGLFYRQRIEAHVDTRTFGFSAVLQTDAGVLSLLALTPYGTRAFLLEQHGQRISFTRYVDRELPFPPRFILLDVHRTLFAGLGRSPLPDGAHAEVVRGEQVRELWRGGRLQERSYARTDGRPAGLIRIRYRGGMRDGIPPPRIELDNGWFGYQLVIHTLALE